MRAIIYLSGLLLCYFNTFGQDINQIRKSFHEAVLDANKVEQFHGFIHSISTPSPIVYAYQGMSEALVAQQNWNPVEKYLGIKKFEDKINSAIKTDSANLEIRFLRICIEYYIPSWLGISNHIEEDKQFILMNLSQVKVLQFDRSFIRYVSVFVKEPGLYSSDQVNLIDKELNAYLAFRSL